MNLPPIVQRHPALRWLAPVAVVGVAGLAATGLFRSPAKPEKLPAMSKTALIAAVQAPASSGFSGTLVSRMSLGLPELPNLGISSTGDGASMGSLLSGSHTLQLWWGGADQQRLALLGATDETDLFRNGDSLWQWSSADRTAVHTALPAAADDPSTTTPDPLTSTIAGDGSMSAAAVTPSGIADDLLGKLEPSTDIEVQDNLTVADRSAYELVLTPRSSSSKVGSVHIAVDGQTKVALGVQIYAREQASPSIDVSFTSINFAQPSANYFSFQPPADAKVTHSTVGRYLPGGSDEPDADDLQTIGSGWTTVYAYRSGKAISLTNETMQRALVPVSGTWGTGRLLESSLFSVLVTSDGRVFSGAVDPDVLYRAAGAK